MHYFLMRKVLKLAQQRRTKKYIFRTKKSISSYRNSNFSLILCSLIRRTKKTQTKKLPQTEIVHSLFPKPANKENSNKETTANGNSTFFNS